MRHIVGLFVFYLSYVKGMQYCYECSSKSALCRHSVYDGQYLSKTPCSSSCFLRIEGDTTFRGCFDGWLEGLVNHNYVGCRHQKYLGETVEWCFCQGSDDPKKNPCNGVSHDELAKMAPSGNGDHVDYDDSQVNYVVPTYPTQPTSGDGKAGKEVSYEVISTDLDDDFPTHKVLEANRIECYSCHDASPYCKNRVTQPQYVAQKSCKTKCFIRSEDDKIYRGCFDGWMTTEVDSDYEGCHLQYYMDKDVKWCFCKTDFCNGGSMRNMHTGYDVAYPVVHSTLPTAKSLVASEVARDFVHGAGAKYSDKQKAFLSKSSSAETVIGWCRNKIDGIYADPYDCSQYIHCYSGFTYRRMCPPGTTWSHKQRNCDYPSLTSGLMCSLAYAERSYEEIDEYNSYTYSPQ